MTLANTRHLQPVHTSALRPVTAANHATGSGVANNSPVLATDPTDGNVMAVANRIDAPDYGCGLNVSGDAGASWSPADPVSQLPAGVENCYAPEVAFDSAGRLYYLFVGLAGPEHQPLGAFLAVSTDGANTFSRPRQVLGARNYSVRMAIDPDIGTRGRLHLVWLHAGSAPTASGFGPSPNPILTAHSDDGGATFSRPVQVSDRKRNRVVAPALALGTDHTVHVAYFDLARDAMDYEGTAGTAWNGTWSLVVASSDGAGRFRRGSVAEAEVVPAQRVMVVFTMPPPALAVRGRRVCLGWTDARHGDADAVARCSQDRGKSWGPRRRLNDDLVGNGAAQYLPQLDLAPGGRLDAIFYDRRGDEQNVNNDVFFTSSQDGGKSFAKNRKLTIEGRSFSLIGQAYAIPSAEGQYDFGSRLSLLSRRQDAVAAWTDTHNSIPPTTAQDVFAADFTPTLARRRSSKAVTAGVGLLAAGIVIAVAGARRRKRVPSTSADSGL